MLIIAPDQEVKQGYYSIVFHMKVYHVFSFESPHRGDSTGHTQDSIFIIKKKILVNHPKSAALGFLASRTSSKQP